MMMIKAGDAHRLNPGGAVPWRASHEQSLVLTALIGCMMVAEDAYVLAGDPDREPNYSHSECAQHRVPRPVDRE